MFYTNETIKTFGYESQEQFVDWFVSEYKNCAIRFDVDGVYADYDLDSYLTYTTI
jgi:hypothetical protein